MLDFAALPPEVNSGLMYTGAGPGPYIAAGLAWDVLADELYATATSFNAVITDLTAAWLGPASIAMAAAAAPFVTWMSATAALAEAMSMQVKAATAAYEAAFAMTVPPPIIAANRSLLALLVATNWFGQNTPAIMLTETHYMQMWAQDATAMYGYLAAAVAATTFTPFTDPPEATTAAALTAATEAAAQAAETPAGTVAQTVNSSLTTSLSSIVSSSPLSSLLTGPMGSMISSELSSMMSGQLSSMISSQISAMMSSQLSSVMSGQLGSVMSGQLGSMFSPLSTATGSNLVSGLATATTMSSSSSSLSSWTASSPVLASATSLLGTGTSAPMSTLGIWSMGSSSSFMQSFSPAAGIFGNQFHTLGLAVGNGFGSGTGLFAAPSMGSFQVAAGAGRAASVGLLSVPQSWTTAAPSSLSQVGASLPSAKITALPAAAEAPAMPPAGTNSMPMIPNAARGSTNNEMPPPLRIGHRPTVVQDHVDGG
jgi:PPE-repeat protein